MSEVCRSGRQLSLRVTVSWGASLGEFLLALVCPIEKVTIRVGLLYLILGAVTDDRGVVKDPS